MVSAFLDYFLPVAGVMLGVIAPIALVVWLANRSQPW